jgi:hypothetical protein
MKPRFNYARCLGAILKMYPVMLSAVSTAAGKTAVRSGEDQKYQGLMKPRVTYAMCLGAILKMYPGMLSAQLLGRLLPEIEKSSNIRDFLLTSFKNNLDKCYMYVHCTVHVRFRRQFTKDLTCEALKTVNKRRNM